MRHWTEVLFVSQAKVSIGLLADVLNSEWQTNCHYLAFLLIKCRLPQLITPLSFYCGEQAEHEDLPLHC